MQHWVAIVLFIQEHQGNMVNRCSVCNNPVAGHEKDFGCKPGPGNCKVQPRTPTGGHPPASAGMSLTSSSSTSVSNINTTSTNALTISSSVSGSSPSVSVSDDSQPGTSNQAGSGAVKLTNAELEQVLEQECEMLKVQLSEAEAKKTLENIYKLQEQKQSMQRRLQELCVSAPVNVQPPTTVRVPPDTQVTWSAGNPFVPPATTSGLSAASFGQASGVPVSASQSSARNMTSWPTASFSSPFMTTQGIPPANLASQSTFLPNLSSQSQLGASLPNLHAGAAKCHLPPEASGITRGSQIAAQSVPNLANMAAMNPSSYPFASSEDIFAINPLAKAILGMSGDVREETAQMGKYIPELFALKYGTINEIRTKMTYSEFIAMYSRMLMFMLRDDPHLVPDRLVFLYNVAKKASKYRWPDVRECYGVAIHEIKIKRRSWADPWDELTEDLEKAHPYPPRATSTRPGQSRPANVRLVSPLDSSRPLCADFNDRDCTRAVCKFFHECAKCGAQHARKNCHTQSDPRPYSMHISNSAPSS